MQNQDIWLDDSTPQKLITNPPSLRAVRLKSFNFTSSGPTSGVAAAGSGSDRGRQFGIECIVGRHSGDVMARFNQGRHISQLTLIAFHARALIPFFHMEAQSFVASLSAHGDETVIGFVCINTKYHHAGKPLAPVSWNLAAAPP